jgi:hypothetical protein
MRRYLVAPVLLALTACASPQQQCIQQTSGQLATLDAQIAEAQANLSRGFAVVDSTNTTANMQRCFAGSAVNNANSAHRGCIGTSNPTVQRTVPVNRQAETQRLAALQKQRDAVAVHAAPAIADCKARFPQ